jgi:hypothetical protein
MANEPASPKRSIQAVKPRLSAVVAALVAAALGNPVPADEITDQIEAARKAYADGELRAAVQGLQFAVAGIQEKVNLSLLQLLPEPLEGWKGEEPQASSSGVAAMIAGTNLSRRYYRDDGADLEISITADSPFLSIMTMMLSNPMMLQADPGSRIYTHAGMRGMIKQDKDAGTWEVSLMGGNNVLIQISGDGVDKETLEAYLGAMDMESVERAFAR